MKPGDPTSFAGPPSPEDMEWRITALLLGELSPEEAAALRETIAASPALTQLHQRLQHTVGVVRDAVHAPETAPADAPSALKLSAERREKLLQTFKVIPPGRLEKERARRQPRRPVFSFREWGNVAAMAAALVVLAGGLMLIQSPSLSMAKMRQRTISAGESYASAWYESSQSGSGAKPAVNAPVVPPAPPVAGPTPADGALGGRVAAAEEQAARKLLSGLAVAKDEPAQTPTQLGRESAVAVDSFALGVDRAPGAKPEGKPSASSTAATQPRQGPGQMLAWSVQSSDLDVKQETEAFRVQGVAGDSASHRFYAGVTGGGGAGGGGLAGGGGGAGGGTVGGVPGGFGGVLRQQVTVAGATPPASGPVAAATGGRQSGQLGNAAAKDLLGNESRFGVIQNEMLTEQAQAAPTVNAWALTPPPAAMPPQQAQIGADKGSTPPTLEPETFRKLEAARIQKAADHAQTDATLSDFAKQQVSFGDTVADKGPSSRAAERPAEPAPRPSRPAPTAPADRKKVEDGTVRLEQQLAERRPDGQRGLGEIADAERMEALIKKPESQSIDPATGLPPEVKPKQALPEVMYQENQAVNQPAGTSTLVQDGRLFYEAGKLGEAENRLREALKTDPNNRAADYYLQLVIEQRSRNANLRGEESRHRQMLDIEQAWAAPAVAGTNASVLTKSRNDGLLRDLNRNAVVEDRSGPVATGKPAESVAKLDTVEPASEPAKLAAVRLQEADGDETRLARAKTPVPEPQPEIETRNNAFSTFSLNVSDVSFKLAGAALEKGVRPDPGSIRTEEFINAFDYRDPEPAPGVPVGFAQERARYPFAHNRDLLRFSIKTAASGRAPGRPLNLVLLLDNSGSMERADRVQIIRACLRVLAGQLRPEDRISVVAFARTARLWVDGLPGSQANELGPRVGGLIPEGGTNLEDALRLAYQTARRHYLANGVNRVVLLTDGAANLGDVNPASLQQQVEVQRRQGYALDCFGIGWEGYNDDLLETLARHGDGRYGFVNTPEAAATDFAAQLAGALQVAAADVKVQIEFNPQRVTLYRQIGYAKHQLTKQQFRDNTVDAAELGAAEAGNALYVVQVNPQGEGPLATVRVRFKNPATGLFSEREWMVPYTGPAAPLEQASPALRLAATASAFSEWLAGSPFAAEVTTDRLSSLLRGVPEAYGSDPRPRKLEWMLRQAR